MWVDDMHVQQADSTPDDQIRGHVIDVKAQRKIEEIDQTLFWVGFNAGAADLQISYRVRILLLLP